jgi:hypothetical protein
VLDDLGTEYVTDFSRAELGDLLNQRYNRKLLTIITSNAWFETLPVRIADRIAEMAEIVYLTAGSYRRLKHNQEAVAVAIVLSLCDWWTPTSCAVRTVSLKSSLSLTRAGSGLVT